jgi:16S rRNA (adenine1518-N6/adenine1519-N6)-dimethyltransferase
VLTQEQIISQDFLKVDLRSVFGSNTFVLCGNFPYNISSQILFHALDYKEEIPAIVGMFQKEVAKRVAATHGNKEYGILSVLMQAYYEVNYLFDVPASAFHPPPKVVSGVITCRARKLVDLVDYKKLKSLVKQAFGQRRKTMRNSLKGSGYESALTAKGWDSLRPEQLSVQEFVELSQSDTP